MRCAKKRAPSLVWAQTVESSGYVPDIVYDQGGMGKEAMVRVFGKTGSDVADKVVRIASGLQSKVKG